MGDAWTAWTDGEFLSYVEEHSGTELALFLPEQALRLYNLAESPAPYLGRGMISLGPCVAGPLVAKARARLRSKALHDGGSIMDAYKDNHPLVALLTEALAVTDPERPPESVVLMDGDVLLEWVKPTAEVVWDGHAFAGHSRQARLTTTDPAEARAWLAAALEVSRG